MRQSGDTLRKMVEMNGHGGCWKWLGSINPKTGYGKKQFDGRTVLAHRWMYSIFNGWIPEGMHLDHRCRNRWCVNPDHLEPVSAAENVRRGSGTRLTREQVEEIKALIASAKWGDRKRIAERFGVSPGVISSIKYGRAWGDVA